LHVKFALNVIDNVFGVEELLNTAQLWRLYCRHQGNSKPILSGGNRHLVQNKSDGLL